MKKEQGFTVLELLVAMTMFAIVSVSMYQLLFGARGGATTVRSVTEISEEARLGLNRMIRDTRQAAEFEETAFLPGPTPTSYSIRVDLDGDNTISNPNPQGDYETETFTYNAAAGTITLRGGNSPGNFSPQYVLISGVNQVGTQPIFSYSSNHLEYDWSVAPACVEICGVTTLQELQDAPSHGVAAFSPLLYLSDVNYVLQITRGARSTDFYGHAQLRNLR